MTVEAKQPVTEGFGFGLERLFKDSFSLDIRQK